MKKKIIIVLIILILICAVVFIKSLNTSRQPSGVEATVTKEETTEETTVTTYVTSEITTIKEEIDDVQPTIVDDTIPEYPTYDTRIR